MERYIENHLYSNCSRYFNINTAPCMVRRIRTIKRKYSAVFFYVVKFKIDGKYLSKKICVKMNKQINFASYGGMQKYCEYLERIRAYVYAKKSGFFAIPRIYDFIESPPLFIIEYIEGANCQKIFFSFDNLFGAIEKNKILLKNCLDFLFFLRGYEKYRLRLDEEPANPGSFITRIKIDMTKEPFIRFKDSLKREISSYLESAGDTVKDSSGTGLVLGDYKSENLLADKNNILWLIETWPQAGSAFLDIAYFMTDIKNNYFLNPAPWVFGLVREYITAILKYLNSQSEIEVSFDTMRFYLFRSIVERTKYYFALGKFFWPFLKRYFKNDIKEILSGRFAGIDLKDFLK